MRADTAWVRLPAAESLSKRQWPGVERLAPLRLSAAAVAAALGALVLLGWGFDLDRLVRPAPGMIATSQLTAVALLLAAAALALGPRRRPVPVRVLAALVLGIGAGRLVAVMVGSSFNIGRPLFVAGLGPADIGAGPMMPSAAVALVLLGGALLLAGSRNHRAVLAVQIQSMIVIVLALFVAIGYGLDSLGLVGAIRVHMSFYTALGLIALAVGTVCVSPEAGITRLLLDRRADGTLARSALPFALFAAVLVAIQRGTPLQVGTNLFVTLLLLIGCVAALLRTDRLRLRRGQAIERSEGYYRHAEQVGHIGHWRVETGSQAVQWSDEVYAICGLPRSTVPSLETKFALYHPDDRAVYRETVNKAIREGREWEVDHRILRPDGEIRHVKSYGVCERDAQGGVSAVFGVLIDITELELARREAEAATQSKAAFLANMSHEIRTPMNGVMGFVELLMDSNLDAKQRRHLLLVQESAQALLKLLNDILDLSKVEAGQLDLSAEPSNVRHDITQCVLLLTPAAEQKGLDLRATFADGFPDSVLIDSLRLRQILFNLLGNAVKFTHQGSVSVTLGESRSEDGRRIIVIKVADTGVGIAEERKAAIFDAFVQADASISRRFGGSGLGLSISRRLANLMGGTIALDSNEDEGTMVTLTLPLDEVFMPAPLDAMPCRDGDAQGRDAGSEVRREASILLVEDIDINQELITEMLMRLGHKVELAVNGAEALALAHRLERDPGAWDMILMDVQMPVMDGLAATRAIRALGGRAATIPIVALTANAFAAEMQECRDAGMNDHVAKPSGFAQLKQAVDLWGNIAESPAPASGFRELETGSVADRFEARLRKSTNRLGEITTLLAEADGPEALGLLREAAGIAHVFAGTAGMFRQAKLGKIAQQVEGELKMILKEPAKRDSKKEAGAIAKLTAALGATAARPDSTVGVSKSS